MTAEPQTEAQRRASEPAMSNRPLLLLALVLGVLVGTTSGCAPVASASAQSAGHCTRDAECTLVDVCGCECRAELGPPLPPMACSEACPGTPCAGHRAVCRAGTCAIH